MALPGTDMIAFRFEWKEVEAEPRFQHFQSGQQRYQLAASRAQSEISALGTVRVQKRKNLVTNVGRRGLIRCPGFD